MTLLTANHLLLFMALVLFLLGLTVFIAGLVTLTLYTGNRDIRSLISQTAKLSQAGSQKGFTEDVTALVNHTTLLLDTLNKLTQTTNGIGLFLTLLGLMMLSAACWIAYQALPLLP
jgi:hypothetical protein